MHQPPGVADRLLFRRKTFAKDSTLAPEDLGDFYGEQRVRRYLALKREADPEARWQTELWKRLFAGR